MVEDHPQMKLEEYYTVNNSLISILLNSNLKNTMHCIITLSLLQVAMASVIPPLSDLPKPSLPHLSGLPKPSIRPISGLPKPSGIPGLPTIPLPSGFPEISIPPIPLPSPLSGLSDIPKPSNIPPSAPELPGLPAISIPAIPSPPNPPEISIPPIPLPSPISEPPNPPEVSGIPVPEPPTLSPRNRNHNFTRPNAQRVVDDILAINKAILSLDLPADLNATHPALSLLKDFANVQRAVHNAVQDALLARPFSDEDKGKIANAIATRKFYLPSSSLLSSSLLSSSLLLLYIVSIQCIHSSIHPMFP